MHGRHIWQYRNRTRTYLQHISELYEDTGGDLPLIETNNELSSITMPMTKVPGPDDTST